MYVIKANGNKELFQKNKIIKTCLRADATRETAEKIAEEIRKSLKGDTTTHEIYRMIISELRKRRDVSSFIFTLREGIASLDSLSFELYIKKILEMHGYKCKWNVVVRGRCIDHQVDIIAKKDELLLIECKHHINYHRYCGLGDMLQVQARLEDVRDGFLNGKNRHDFSGAWVITNTKFSDHAKVYARAKDIELTGWRHKGDNALENLIQSKKIFPVTILRCSSGIKHYLLEKKIITLMDLLSADAKKLKKIDKFRLDGLKRQAVKLLS